VDKILLLELAVGFTAALPKDSDRPANSCSYWTVGHLCPLPRMPSLWSQTLLPCTCGHRTEHVNLFMLLFHGPWLTLRCRCMSFS